MFELAAHILVFWLVIGLLGMPLALRLPLDPVEKIAAGAAMAVIAIGLLAGAIYLLDADPRWCWLLPFAALLAGLEQLGGLRRWFAHRDVRQALIAYALVTSWCLGWLGLIVNYSGGSWAGDWMEHYHRMRFFLEQWPSDTLLTGLYELPARPPLANLALGAFETLARGGFASFQLFSALLASLVFWPVCLLARRWGGLTTARAANASALALALSPLFLQNATFTWTKLPAAFFVLLGVYFFTEALRRPDVKLRLAAATFLGAALVTDYSAGPYLAGLLAFALWQRPFTRRQAAKFLGAAALLPALWLVCSVFNYGLARTFDPDTSLPGHAHPHATWSETTAGNFARTFLPQPLGFTDGDAVVQSHVAAGWRDFFFNLYQVNLPWAFGSVGFILVVGTLLTRWREHPAGPRLPVAVAIAVTLLTGLLITSSVDPQGTGHLGFQGLVLGGVALLAARWPGLSTGWRRALVAGWAFDALTGIALHFANQSLLIDRWLHPHVTVAEVIARFSPAAQMNLNAKLRENTLFSGEYYQLPPDLLLTGLGLLLAILVFRAWPTFVDLHRPTLDPRRAALRHVAVPLQIRRRA